MGERCKISVKDNIQGANLEELGKGDIIILDGDRVDNQWVDVISRSLIGRE